MLAFAREDVRRDLQQALVFRAMQLPNAAVRTLLPILDRSVDAKNIFLQLQRGFAWEEYLHTGSVSEFRRRILTSMNQDIQIPGVPGEEFRRQSDSSPISDEAIRLYLRGDPSAATQQLTDDTAESMYAAYVLFHDAGRLDLSEEAALQLSSRYPNHELTLLLSALSNVE